MRNAIRAFGLAATLLAVAAVSAWAAPGAILVAREGFSDQSGLTRLPRAGQRDDGILTGGLTQRRLQMPIITPSSLAF